MKAKISGFVVYRKPDSLDDGQGFKFFICEMKQYGYVTVMPFTIEVDIPEGFDPRKKQVEQLKEEKQKAMADFQAMVTAIDRQIAELTALEYTS